MDINKDLAAMTVCTHLLDVGAWLWSFVLKTLVKSGTEEVWGEFSGEFSVGMRSGLYAQGYCHTVTGPGFSVPLKGNYNATECKAILENCLLPEFFEDVLHTGVRRRCPHTVSKECIRCEALQYVV